MKQGYKVGDLFHHENLDFKVNWLITGIEPDWHETAIVEGDMEFLQEKEMRIGEKGVFQTLERFILGKHPNSSEWEMPPMQLQVNSVIHSKCGSIEFTVFEAPRGYSGVVKLVVTKVGDEARALGVKEGHIYYTSISSVGGLGDTIHFGMGKHPNL